MIVPAGKLTVPLPEPEPYHTVTLPLVVSAFPIVNVFPDVAANPPDAPDAKDNVYPDSVKLALPSKVPPLKLI